MTRVVTLTTLLAVCLGAPVSAQPLEVSQYAHTAWRHDAWSPEINLRGSGQTPDGYLWFATGRGIYHFDGTRFTRWQPPTGQKLPEIMEVFSVTKDGRLWVGTRKEGLFSWQAGKLTRYLDGRYVVSRVVDSVDGTMWFTLLPRSLCAIRAEALSCNDTMEDRPSSLVTDRAGFLWFVMRSAIWRWAPGVPRRYTLPGGATPERIVADSDGALLIVGTGSRLWRLAGETIEEYPVGDVGHSPLSGNTPDTDRLWSLFRSRDGTLWLGTRQGILHVRDGKTDRFIVADGLSGSNVLSFYEDREGNVWAHTEDGVDRFRPVPVRTISSRQGLASTTVRAVQASPTGDVWLSTAGGLNRVAAGTTSVVNTELRGPVYALGLDAQGRLLASTPAS